MNANQNKEFQLADLFKIYGLDMDFGSERSFMDFEEQALKERFPNHRILKFYYRLFDVRFIAYDKAFIEQSRENIMSSFIDKENIGLLTIKGKTAIGITKDMMNTAFLSSADKNYLFPLYLYNDTETPSKRIPNFNQDIVDQIATHVSLKFTYQKEEGFSNNASPVCYAQSPELREGFEIDLPPTSFAPIDLFDYIYAVLHSAMNREKQKGLSRTEFPRILYPKNKQVFWQLVKLGGKLRRVHLLESAKLGHWTTSFPVKGNNVVSHSFGEQSWELQDVENKFGRVWINDEQYFDKVPLVAWSFFIGGYHPAQAWLKDRKGRELNTNDISHYQKIIVALIETDRLMKAIDKIDIY